MRELRPHLTESQMSAQIKEQQAQGYQLAIAETNGKVLGVVGFVIAKKLAWGKHIYVDDLVIAGASRSAGILLLKILDFLK